MGIGVIIVGVATLIILQEFNYIFSKLMLNFLKLKHYLDSTLLNTPSNVKFKNNFAGFAIFVLAS